MELGLLVLVSYFLPSIVASSRKHHSAGSVFVLNLFLGWTFIGWVVALAWACGRVIPSAPPAVQVTPAYVLPSTAPTGPLTLFRRPSRTDRFCGGCGAKRRIADALFCLDCGGAYLPAR